MTSEKVRVVQQWLKREKEDRFIIRVGGRRRGQKSIQTIELKRGKEPIPTIPSQEVLTSEIVCMETE